jgi:hypothetical protein
MEAMRVRVQSIVVHVDVVHAVVIAVSKELMVGKPRASLTLYLSLEGVKGETVKNRLTRVREEALRYLDVN